MEDADGPSSGAGQIICREYGQARKGHLSSRQRIAKKVQQRKLRENREISISSLADRPQFLFTDMFDDAGRRRSGRERKQVEIENINYEPPKPRYRRPVVCAMAALSCHFPSARAFIVQ
jgi:hypothetical protein